MNDAPHSPRVLAEAREAFNGLVRDIRPKLHRYCARMTGSAMEAEDIVQDALAKAYFLLPTTPVRHLEGWLFRILHNKTIDYLRRRKQVPEPVDEAPSATVEVPPLEAKELAAFALSIYLSISPMQRSCVLFKDVMGYSLAEISEMLDATVGAIKAALHRGRTNLRKRASTLQGQDPLQLEEPEASLLIQYVAHFNARNFDAVRAMLIDDVRLDLVDRVKARGASEVGNYFHNYGLAQDWYCTIGFVEGRPAVLVSHPDRPDTVDYFVFIRWEQGKIFSIRDFRYARFVMADAVITKAVAKE